MVFAWCHVAQFGIFVSRPPVVLWCADISSSTNVEYGRSIGIKGISLLYRRTGSSSVNVNVNGTR